MKKILSILIVSILLCSCADLQGNGREIAGDVNVPEEELREIVRTKKTPVYSMSESTGSYDLEGCDRWGNTITVTSYAAADDQWFCKQEYLYYPDDVVYQCTVTYNREFYDGYHGQVDWLDLDDYCPEMSVCIYRYAHDETLLSQETYYPDGMHMYQEFYSDGSIKRDAHFENEVLFYDIRYREDGTFRYTEDYIYEEGILVTSFIYDYDEGTASLTEYRNGEIFSEVSWKIDEHGNRID